MEPDNSSLLHISREQYRKCFLNSLEQTRSILNCRNSIRRRSTVSQPLSPKQPHLKKQLAQAGPSHIIQAQDFPPGVREPAKLRSKACELSLKPRCSEMTHSGALEDVRLKSANTTFSNIHAEDPACVIDNLFDSRVVWLSNTGRSGQDILIIDTMQVVADDVPSIGAHAHSSLIIIWRK